ncbi:hypothetical protein QC764_213580 [Podospora pseudoanserina]|uniref:Uncharacterized protein n=1 Tax=Podospora pseudoanserina TaxID=2609844 RepID=A0ABR0IK54_9PEZI|nr:hypothetical protein QC764_213580 [Podospora pseudoanserina]
MTSRQGQTPKGTMFRQEFETESRQHDLQRTTPTPAKAGSRELISGACIPPEEGSDAIFEKSSRHEWASNRTLQHQYDELATPSSTIAEFGDKAARFIVPSATVLVDHVHRSWNDSRDGSRSASINKSRSRSSSNRRPHERRRGRGERREGSRDRSIASVLSLAEEEQPQTSTQKQHRHARSQVPKSTSVEAMRTDEKVDRFLKSMRPHQSPSPPQASQLGKPPEFEKPSGIDSLSDLTAENKSLYQRVAALQLTERELLAENQNLIRQVATLNHQLAAAVEELEASKQQQGIHNQHWHRLFAEKEDQYQSRIHELGTQLVELSSTHPNPKKSRPLASNDEIATWFTDQDAAWRAWARVYGHRDPSRLVDGLHPAQLQEICAEVRGFVQLTNLERLPGAILHGGKEAAHTLLQAMLANFFCDEVLESPYWVFKATSLGTLESPSASLPPHALGSVSEGLKVNMDAFGSGGNNVAGVRESVRGSGYGSGYQVPKSPKYPPPLIMSMTHSLGAGCASMLGLPLKGDMERLQLMLEDSQDPSPYSQQAHWRAQMMRLFATGGMGLSHSSSSSTCSASSSRQALIDSRLNYARKLRDRFLGGAARFLLHDQDALGIERLERVLTEMIDDALRLSCKLWSRPGGIRLKRWKDLPEFKNGYKNGMKSVKICQAQDKSYTVLRQTMADPGKDEEKEDENEGRPVIMVVQPAVEAVIDTGHSEAPSLVWLKARVMVAAPVEEPVPGSGASDAGFAPSPVTARGEAFFPPSRSAGEADRPSHAFKSSKSSEILSAVSYVGHTVGEKKV